MNNTLAFILITILLLGCTPRDNEPVSELQKPDVMPLTFPNWAKNANRYEVNLRQYTPEGTFKAFEAHLPRLKEMGVDILWLMPIHPVGKVKRKGGMGSYYSVADYKSVNPDHGTLEDFKSLVAKIHELDMYVILDWVANHSSWDNPWITEHPDWYTMNGDTITHPLNEKGEPTDWYDVADLNYDNSAMRAGMIDALEYWVTECDIDGYRADVAGFVPYDFWVDARKALHQHKQLFMLAEWEDARHTANNSFDMYYTWGLHHIMNDVAKGNKTVSEFDKYFKEKKEKFDPRAIPMNFTSNHDENSWNGSEYERMKANVLPMAVFAATIPGMPLVYSGQESAFAKKLAFFEKDEIDWKDYSLSNFYKTLLSLKKKNKALWNSTYGGELEKLTTKDEEGIYGYLREKEGDKVAVLLNFSDKEHKVKLDQAIEGFYDAFNGDKINIKAEEEVVLKANSYLVFSNK